jgi:hypothetical protein
MLKQLTALFLLAPAAAQAFTNCKLTDIGGPGAHIAEEGSNPVVSRQWAYSAFTQATKVVFLVASDYGATQFPLQTIFDEPGVAAHVRVAAAGNFVYVTWQHTGKVGNHLWLAASANHGKKGSWGAPVDLGEVRHALQQIFADGTNVHIAYVATNGDTAVFSSADSGKTFGTPTDLGESSGEVVITSHGKNVYTSWEIGRTAKKPSIGFGYSHDGGLTFTVSNLTLEDGPEAHEPILSLNQKNGRLSLIWREHDPTQGAYLQSLDNGQTWSTPVVIDTDSRQFMVQDNGPTIFVSYLKQFMIGGKPDWQVQLAVSKDGGHTFPFIQNLSGPTGVNEIVGDNARPVPWSTSGKIVITGVMADGAYIWSGDRGRITSDKLYLGPGELASPQNHVALWQEPEGVITYAYCTDGNSRKH